MKKVKINIGQIFELDKRINETVITPLEFSLNKLSNLPEYTVETFVKHDSPE